MELHLPRELEGRLAAAASRRSVSIDVLAREALERAVDCDDWFLREVGAGLAQIDAGQTLTHDAVGARLVNKLATDLERIDDYLLSTPLIARLETCEGDLRGVRVTDSK